MIRLTCFDFFSKKLMTDDRYLKSFSYLCKNLK